jgi:hypothetical protein
MRLVPGTIDPIKNGIPLATIHYYDYYENPSARGAYMLRKPLVLVFVRLRVKAQYQEVTA